MQKKVKLYLISIVTYIVNIAAQAAQQASINIFSLADRYLVLMDLEQPPMSPPAVFLQYFTS